MWGLYWLPQRLLLDAGLSGGWGTVIQYVISFAVLAPIAVWRVSKGESIGLQHWACGLLLGSGAIFYANSFLVTEVIRALIFFYLTPLWATLVEILFLKRWPKWPRMVSIGLLIAAGAARTEMEQPDGVFPLLFIVIVFCLITSIGQYPLLADAIGTMPSIEVVISSLPFLFGISLLFVIPTTAIIFWSPSKIGTGVFGILILSELAVGVIDRQNLLKPLPLEKKCRDSEAFIDALVN